MSCLDGHNEPNLVRVIDTGHWSWLGVTSGGLCHRRVLSFVPSVCPQCPRVSPMMSPVPAPAQRRERPAWSQRGGWAEAGDRAGYSGHWRPPRLAGDRPGWHWSWVTPRVRPQSPLSSHHRWSPASVPATRAHPGQPGHQSPVPAGRVSAASWAGSSLLVSHVTSESKWCLVSRPHRHCIISVTQWPMWHHRPHAQADDRGWETSDSTQLDVAHSQTRGQGQTHRAALRSSSTMWVW